MIFSQKPLSSLPDCPPYPACFLILCDSDCGARASSTCISWSFLEMQSLRFTQTSWLSTAFEQDLPVKSFLSHRQFLMTDNLWFPKYFLWHFEIELMNHPNLSGNWTWGSRRLSYRFIHFYILQSMPLHHNLVSCDSTAFPCIFPWSLSSSQAVFFLLPPSPHQPPAGTGRISHRLIPAWTQRQRQCEILSPPDGIRSKMNLAAPSRARCLFGLFPGEPCTPLSCRFLFQPSCGFQFFLLTASSPDLKHPLCSVTSAPLSHHHLILTNIDAMPKLSSHRTYMWS